MLVVECTLDDEPVPDNLTRVSRERFAERRCSVRKRRRVQTGGMDRSTALDSLDLESSRFLVAVSNGAVTLDTPLPTCPGWDVAELVNHLGILYSRVALVVSARQTGAPDRGGLPTAPDGEARLGWLAEQRTAVLAALETADEDAPVWNWTVDSPGATSFWSRRLTHETLIHRVDVELAQGFEPAHAYPEVATDTVTEFFELFYPRFATQILAAGLGGSMHLHATDVAGAEWTLDPLGGASITSEHAKADVALRGSAFELACWTWGRLPIERLEILGDRQIADRFRAVVRV
jgi:uncharacterized protein (TIGR03083 family)